MGVKYCLKVLLNIDTVLGLVETEVEIPEVPIFHCLVSLNTFITVPSAYM